MKKLLYVSLMGGVLATVDAPVMATREESADNHKLDQVKLTNRIPSRDSFFNPKLLLKKPSEEACKIIDETELKYLPPKVFIPELTVLIKQYSGKFSKMIARSQLRYIPLPNCIPTLRLLLEKIPEETKQMIARTQLTDIPQALFLPVFQFLTDNFYEELSEVIGRLQLRHFPLGKSLPVLTLIKERFPDQFDRIVENISELPRFKALFPEYQKPQLGFFQKIIGIGCGFYDWLKKAI